MCNIQVDAWLHTIFSRYVASHRIVGVCSVMRCKGERSVEREAANWRNNKNRLCSKNCGVDEIVTKVWCKKTYLKKQVITSWTEAITMPQEFYCTHTCTQLKGILLNAPLTLRCLLEDLCPPCSPAGDRGVAPARLTAVFVRDLSGGWGSIVGAPASWEKSPMISTDLPTGKENDSLTISVLDHCINIVWKLIFSLILICCCGFHWRNIFEARKLGSARLKKIICKCTLFRHWYRFLCLQKLNFCSLLFWSRHLWAQLEGVLSALKLPLLWGNIRSLPESS